MQIMSAFKNVIYYIRFLNCKIQIDSEFDTTLLNEWGARWISFAGSGAKDKSNWADNPEDFVGILKALGSNSDVAENLNMLDTTDCDLDYEYTQDALNLSGLTRVGFIDKPYETTTNPWE